MFCYLIPVFCLTFDILQDEGIMSCPLSSRRPRRRERIFNIVNPYGWFRRHDSEPSSQDLDSLQIGDELSETGLSLRSPSDPLAASSENHLAVDGIHNSNEAAKTSYSNLRIDDAEVQSEVNERKTETRVSGTQTSAPIQASPMTATLDTSLDRSETPTEPCDNDGESKSRESDSSAENEGSGQNRGQGRGRGLCRGGRGRYRWRRGRNRGREDSISDSENTTENASQSASNQDIESRDLHSEIAAKLERAKLVQSYAETIANTRVAHAENIAQRASQIYPDGVWKNYFDSYRDGERSVNTRESNQIREPRQHEKSGLSSHGSPRMSPFTQMIDNTPSDNTRRVSDSSGAEPRHQLSQNVSQDLADTEEEQMRLAMVRFCLNHKNAYMSHIVRTR